MNKKIILSLSCIIILLNGCKQTEIDNTQTNIIYKQKNEIIKNQQFKNLINKIKESHSIKSIIHKINSSYYLSLNNNIYPDISVSLNTNSDNFNLNTNLNSNINFNNKMNQLETKFDHLELQKLNLKQELSLSILNVLNSYFEYQALLKKQENLNTKNFYLKNKLLKLQFKDIDSILTLKKELLNNENDLKTINNNIIELQNYLKLLNLNYQEVNNLKIELNQVHTINTIHKKPSIEIILKNIDIQNKIYQQAIRDIYPSISLSLNLNSDNIRNLFTNWIEKFTLTLTQFLLINEKENISFSEKENLLSLIETYKQTILELENEIVSNINMIDLYQKQKEILLKKFTLENNTFKIFLHKYQQGIINYKTVITQYLAIKDLENNIIDLNKNINLEKIKLYQNLGVF